VFVPNVELAQGAMVVNYPSLAYPFIRIHETKHASGQDCEGTVLGIEFTGMPARHYPIPTTENVALSNRYQDFLRQRLGIDRVFFAGRLATYGYLDMDDCMRQALDITGEILATVRA
jgi:UDP-galactopyranose mutase